MGSFATYSQRVEATVSGEAWDECYFSLLSLKHTLQGIPGWDRMDIWANQIDDERMHVIVITNWEYPEQLETWLLHGKITVEGVLKGCDPPPESLDVRFYEEIG
jgi:hypothetical protein